jgi:peptidoglycan/xylan/chitin deacetylase (PgdA/CDA1 family)
MWTIDPQDWHTPGSDVIAASVLEDIRGTGDVVLLHDAGGDRHQTVEALGEILDAARCSRLPHHRDPGLLRASRSPTGLPSGERRVSRYRVGGRAR